jgi:hypothetical protein
MFKARNSQVQQITSTLARLHLEEGLTVILIERRLAAVASLARARGIGGRRSHRGRWSLRYSPDQQTAPGIPGQRYPWLDAGRGVEATDLTPAPDDGHPLVTLRQVTAGYGGPPAVSGLDLACCCSRTGSPSIARAAIRPEAEAWTSPRVMPAPSPQAYSPPTSVSSC